jgi:thiol:disulfide interchange protein DsbD
MVQDSQMNRRHFVAIRPVMLASGLIALACLASGAIAAGQQRGDPFDPANQAKADPFSILNQAPPPVLTVDKGAQQNGGKGKEAPEHVTDIKQVIDLDVKVEPPEVKRGQTVKVIVSGRAARGWHTYAMTRQTPDQVGGPLSTFRVRAASGFRPLGPVEESPPPEFEFNQGLKKFFWVQEQPFTWSFQLLVEPGAPVGRASVPFSIDMQVCKESCFFGPIALTASFTVQPGDAVPVAKDVTEQLSQGFPPLPVTMVADGSRTTTDAPKSKVAEDSLPKSATVPRDYKESIERVRVQFLAPQAQSHDGLWMFMLAGVFWGFVSLITPCVFPMIPITVSFFLKQSEKEHHKPVTMATVYCGTIVIVLTVAAAALLNFFRVLSISPVMNFGIGLLFIFFALSLFGMYEIELPSFLARFTSERESRGGMVGTIFMALTFTIISFACVAPFLGGFGGTAGTAGRPFWQTILGGLAFSVTFASPFFVLALFPTLLKTMPKSGSWLNSVKVVMGFLELAAALKFFRAAELVLPSPLGLFTFDLVLGLWVALCMLAGLYLLGVYRLPHDSPAEHLSVPRMLFAFAFLGLAFYLSPALFVKAADGEETRPNGAVFAWVNSFLLPEPRAAKSEVWTPNLEDAIAQAREYKKATGKTKLVFIDFTGEICTNCSLNENNVFSKAEIQKLFKPYILVRLYCDTVPTKYYAAEDRAAAEAGRRKTDATLNADFEKAIFNTSELPLYAILEPLPDGRIKVLHQYGGLIRSDAEFAEFLKQPQQAIGANVAAR